MTKNYKSLLPVKIGFFALILALSITSCKKRFTCKVHTYTEHWGVSGVPPNFSPFLSWVKDTTEYITVTSTEKDIHITEQHLSECRIDSLPSAAEGHYIRTITLKEVTCY